MDIAAFLHTRRPRAVYLDPSYLRRGRRDQRTIMRAVCAIDQQAFFSRERGRVLVARFRHRGQLREITFIRGVAGRDDALASEYIGGKAVYLAKGCLAPEILCPATTVEIRPSAFALVLLDLPRFTTTVKRAYREPLFEGRHPPLQLLLYRRNHHSQQIYRRARAELDALLHESEARKG